MSTARSRAHVPGRSFGHHGSPIVDDDPRIPLWAPEFAADPYRAFGEMRQHYRSLVPVELSPGVPATLVIEHRTAVRILNDHEHFPADPRTWERSIPSDCPIRPMMEWRPIPSRSTGVDFQRYRSAIMAGMDKIDLHTMHQHVEKMAIPLINQFCEVGRADLISQFAFPIAFEICNYMLGCPPEIGQKVAQGFAMMVNGGADALDGNSIVNNAVAELVEIKRQKPGDDVTTMLLNHSSNLKDDEVIQNIVISYGSGIELQQSLLGNTLLLILDDGRFGGYVVGGSLSTRDALDEVLFDNPPLSNYLVTYPRQPILIDDVWLPAHQPVVVSIAACNNDPAIRADEQHGNRAHLSWGLGQRTCPSKTLSYLAAQDAIDQLLDAIPEMDVDFPTGEPEWRPGPFHRSLVSLPVTFDSMPPLNHLM